VVLFRDERLSVRDAGERLTALHRPTFRANSILIVVFLVLALLIGMRLPERYPVHFGLAGAPTRFANGPGEWILLVAVLSISVVKTHLLQRFLLSGTDVSLLNVPMKDRFLRLPEARKLPVLLRLNRLLGLVNTGVLVMSLAVIILIHLASHGGGPVAIGMSRWALHGALAVVLVVPFVEVIGIRRMIRRKLGEEGLLNGAGGTGTAGRNSEGRRL